MRGLLQSLLSRFFKPALSIEVLAAHLEASADKQARAHLEALRGQGHSWLARNLKSVIKVFQDKGKLELLVDTLLSPQVPSFDHLVVAQRLGQLARLTRRFGDFQRRVLSTVENGGYAHFRQFDFIPKMMNSSRDPQLYRLLLKLKYNGIGGYERPDLLFANARALASRVILGNRMLDRLYQNRQVQSQPRPAWEQSIKTAYALQHLIIDCRIAKADQVGLVDTAAGDAVLAKLNPTRGALLLLFHVGFPTVSSNFLKNYVDGIVYVATGEIAEDRREQAPDRIVVNADPRAALFAALKALLKKRIVILAPDGGQGAQKTTISVLGKPSLIGVGAGFLAYESKCDTFWFSMNRSEDRFVPVMIAGPSRMAVESFPEFQQRLNGFCEKMLNSFFSGNPQNLFLKQRWANLFNEK